MLHMVETMFLGSDCSAARMWSTGLGPGSPLRPALPLLHPHLHRSQSMHLSMSVDLPRMIWPPAIPAAPKPELRMT